MTRALGVSCTSGCRTRDHASYGECLRSKRLRVAYAQSAKGLDYTAEKSKERELDAYREARAAGIQPDGTTMRKVEAANALSDSMGAAYGTDSFKAAQYKKAGL